MGSCYLDAVLTGLAANSENYGPSLLKQMSDSDFKGMGIKPETNAPHYLVTFFKPDGKKIAIIVESTDFIKSGSLNKIHQHDHWARIVKKAFGLYRNHFYTVDESKINKKRYDRYDTKDATNQVKQHLTEMTKMLTKLDELVELKLKPSVDSLNNNELSNLLLNIKKNILNAKNVCNDNLLNLKIEGDVIAILNEIKHQMVFYPIENIKTFIEVISENKAIDQGALMIVMTYFHLVIRIWNLCCPLVLDLRMY